MATFDLIPKNTEQLEAQITSAKRKVLGLFNNGQGPTQPSTVASSKRMIPVEQKQAFVDQAVTGGDLNENLLPEVLGLPPDNYFPETNRKIRDSMPVCYFSPSQPVFEFGLDLFKLRPAFNSSSNTDPDYARLLRDHGLEAPNNWKNLQAVQVAFLADNFPTDTFTNEYGENFLQGLTDVASSTASQISQFFGVKDARTVINKAAGAAENMLPKEVMGIGVKGPVGDFFRKGADVAQNVLNAAKLGGAPGIIGRMATGARLDFPMTWKSSGFQPSYSLTVRLYNPNPRSLKSTKKYIVGPIVALMLLGVPITQDGSTYSWPFLHKIVSPGIFELNPGFISNITVIKGGDQQQISQQQRLSMVDVRIDVGSLYSTMVGGSVNLGYKSRPTVKKYMDNMLQQGANANYSRHEIFDRKGQKLGTEAYEFVKVSDNISSLATDPTRESAWSRRQRKFPQASPGQAAAAVEDPTEPTTRVSTSRRNVGAFLAVTSPQGYGFRATDEEQ
jgi:hypothetical protein